MNEVVAKASISPSFIFCLDLSSQKFLGQAHMLLGSRGLEQGLWSHTLQSLNPGSGTYYSLGKVIQAVSLILYLKDRIFMEW